MDIIHTQYKNLKGRDGYTFNTDETKERVRKRILTSLTSELRANIIENTNLHFYFQHLNALRDQAKAITNMAATVPYRMPGDTNSRLVQTEILMH